LLKYARAVVAIPLVSVAPLLLRSWIGAEATLVFGAIALVAFGFVGLPAVLVFGHSFCKALRPPWRRGAVDVYLLTVLKKGGRYDVHAETNLGSPGDIVEFTIRDYRRFFAQT
jgi:hypothetical protein